MEQEFLIEKPELEDPSPPLPNETPEPRTEGLFCPNCGARLEGRKCKLFCPRPGCGYLVTCSEW